MTSKLDARYYVDQTFFALEQKRIFGSLWIFAGLTSEVNGVNAYVLRKIGGREVIVQRCAGGLRAFENTCPHRLTPIHWEPAGRRPLVCKYHGWSFNEDGRVKNIPYQDQAYGPGAWKGERTCLTRFGLATVGKFIFVNVGSPFPIEKQFNPAMIEQLESLSLHMDDNFEKREFVRPFNWKLAYENLRDILHVRFLHTKSLGLQVDFGDTKPPAFETLRSHFSLAALSWGGPDAPLPRANDPWHQDVRAWPCEDAYYNWLLYPNLHIVTATHGHSFSIEYHEPVAPGETRLHLYMVTATRKESAWDPKPILDRHYADSQIILDEDYEVLERIQANLAHTTRAPQLGRFEWWNQRVERWYLRHLGTSRWHLLVQDSLYLGSLPAMIVRYLRSVGGRRFFNRLLGILNRSPSTPAH